MHVLLLLLLQDSSLTRWLARALHVCVLHVSVCVLLYQCTVEAARVSTTSNGTVAATANGGKTVMVSSAAGTTMAAAATTATAPPTATSTAATAVHLTSPPSKPVSSPVPAAASPSPPHGAARYEIQGGPPLGKGHFAVVRKCRDRVTGAICAVKIIDKKEMVKSTAAAVRSEIEILRAVGAHPNVVQLLDHFEDASKHYLVMQYCAGEWTDKRKRGRRGV